MAAINFDTLKLARALRDDAGLDQRQPEGAAGAIALAIGEATASKDDVASLRTDMKAEFADSRHDIEALRKETKAEFANVRAEMKAEFADVRAEMRAGFETQRLERLASEQRLLIRLGGFTAALLGLFFAATRYLALH